MLRASGRALAPARSISRSDGPARVLGGGRHGGLPPTAPKTAGVAWNRARPGSFPMGEWGAAGHQRRRSRTDERTRTWRARAMEPTCKNAPSARSEEHTSELQSRGHLVCRLQLEKKKISTKYGHEY